MMQNNVNPFSTRFWQAGVFPFQFADETTLEILFADILLTRLSQIAGLHGSGKSTLLQNIAELAKRKGYAVHFAFLNNEQQQLPPDFFTEVKNSTGNDLFLLDGYEQLPFYKRFLLCRLFRNKAAHLVWTTHRPAWFVPVLYKTNPQYKCFKQLAEELLKKQNTEINEVRLLEVFTKFNGNFRDAFMQMYDEIENDCFYLDEYIR